MHKHTHIQYIHFSHCELLSFLFIILPLSDFMQHQNNICTVLSENCWHSNFPECAAHSIFTRWAMYEDITSFWWKHNVACTKAKDRVHISMLFCQISHWSAFTLHIMLGVSVLMFLYFSHLSVVISSSIRYVAKLLTHQAVNKMKCHNAAPHTWTSAIFIFQLCALFMCVQSDHAT